jgi:DNA-binding MarR family transcriptional regulator
MSELADDVWALITALVTDSRGDYRRAVIDAVGMPFSRVRLLRRLVEGPLTLKALADAATIDAPAATVAVSDLEQRGLVSKTASASNGREKVVSITPAGRAVFERAASVRQPAPEWLSALADEQLEQLRALLENGGSGRPG